MRGAERDMHLSRRGFVKVGLATAAAVGLSNKAMAAGPDDKKPDILPTRKLGRTGEQVTILNLGTGRKQTRRMLDLMYKLGIRFIDTAASYAQGLSEQALGKWMEKNGNRKEFFITTKDLPRSPEEWVQMVDRRLENLQTDYIDMFFIHEIGGGFGQAPNDARMEWPRSKEWAAAADKMKKSGKVRFAGFSSHSDVDVRCEVLNRAVDGGWTDAILVATDPYTMQTHKEYNKALDKCFKAGVGLISMKEMRGVADIDKALPKFKEMGLTPQQAVLHAVWSDERFTAISSDMPNVKILKENAEAARKFKMPLDKKQMAAVIDLYRMDGRRYCNACDGTCRRAAGTKARLGDIARYLTYYELDGRRDDARSAYAALSPEERDWADADLAAAQQACHCGLDFAAILPRAQSKLA